MSYENLVKFLDSADDIDREEGALAYRRYRQVMEGIADRYGFELRPTVAAFAALSPNNDYLGNLRSLVSVLVGIKAGSRCDDITVSTYKACRDRAFYYLKGMVDFEKSVKGPKIRAFYFNILDPDDDRHVTIDGHMAAAYRQHSGTMKQNIIPLSKYREIEAEVKRLARDRGMVPNSVQATIWFARKRLLNVKYNAQLGLFDASNDRWRTLIDVDEIRPFKAR